MAVCCLLNWALMAGTILLSADYSQLELRILAHLSEDAGLCSVLSQPDGDVFRGIVSVWKKKKQEEVRDDERQKAKQICYGSFYGMGCKCLAEQLEVGEEEAQLFVNTFHATYPKFINHIVMVSTALGQEKENAGTVCYNHDSSYILLRWKTILYCVMTKMLNRRRKKKKKRFVFQQMNKDLLDSQLQLERSSVGMGLAPHCNARLNREIEIRKLTLVMEMQTKKFYATSCYAIKNGKDKWISTLPNSMLIGKCNQLKQCSMLNN
ncbi:hypothetical protein OUZ56_017742 [Daphnia magna]|uniref:DNA-directed DNA polymerase n=1 Tax=Daphnia magna TaxID=35525 RepID=A0ABR0ATN9_9CRUS|nr:hypothetical protein OUZ56_017742 [Daphnia magna]